jgi:uncharacterized protein with NRDE domain
MCLLALAWRMHPHWRLVLIANRDELHERPTLRADRWAEAPYVVGGKDLQFGGAWLGVSEQGRLAVVNNVRDPGGASAHLASRGLLTRRFLMGELDLESLQKLDPLAFRPFNLVAIEQDEALYLTNRPPMRRPLEPGLHGLSNGPLDDPWPKTKRAKAGLKRWLAGDAVDTEPLFAVLADETPAPDDELPDTGVGLERERSLSPCFLRGPVYGTRCSTVIRIDVAGRGEFVERSFGPDGAAAGEARLAFGWPATADRRQRLP